MRPLPNGITKLYDKPSDDHWRRLSKDAVLWMGKNVRSADPVDESKMPTGPDGEKDPGERPFGYVTVEELRRVRTGLLVRAVDVATALGIPVKDLLAYENGERFDYPKVMRHYVAASRLGIILG